MPTCEGEKPVDRINGYSGCPFVLKSIAKSFTRVRAQVSMRYKSVLEPHKNNTMKYHDAEMLLHEFYLREEDQT